MDRKTAWTVKRHGPSSGAGLVRQAGLRSGGHRRLAGIAQGGSPDSHETGAVAEGAVMADPAQVARSMWTLFEPIHAVTYFTPEARAAYEEQGLHGFWRGYLVGRAAPLGPTGAAVVTASFYNFAPAMVARAIPAVWELSSPGKALPTRAPGRRDRRIRRLLAGRDEKTAVVADQLARVAASMDCAGRVLAAANTALPGPGHALADSDIALARLWQAATALREHRGDGHFAAMAAADIDGCEALVLRCALDMRREDVKAIRGSTNKQWDAAQARLADRGLIGPDGEITDAGRAAHAAPSRRPPTGPPRGPGNASGGPPRRTSRTPCCRSRRPAPRRFPTPAPSACLRPAPHDGTCPVRDPGPAPGAEGTAGSEGACGLRGLLGLKRA